MPASERETESRRRTVRRRATDSRPPERAPSVAAAWPVAVGSASRVRSALGFSARRTGATADGGAGTGWCIGDGAGRSALGAGGGVGATAGGVGAGPARQPARSSTSVSRGPSSLCPCSGFTGSPGATSGGVSSSCSGPVESCPGVRSPAPSPLPSWDSGSVAALVLALLLRRRLGRIGQRGVGGGGHQCDREDAGPDPSALSHRPPAHPLIALAAQRNGRPPAKVFGTVSTSPDWLITTRARSWSFGWARDRRSLPAPHRASAPGGVVGEGDELLVARQPAPGGLARDAREAVGKRRPGRRLDAAVHVAAASPAGSAG